MAWFLVKLAFDSIGIETVLARLKRRRDLVPALDFPNTDRVDILEGADVYLPSLIRQIDDEIREAPISTACISSF